MTEVLFSAALTGDCPASETAKAAKRLARILPSLAITAVKR